MNRTTFNIEYNGVWLDVDVKRGISRLDGKHLVHPLEVRHADENITDILVALALVQIAHIIEKELANPMPVFDNPLDKFPTIWSKA